MDELNDDGLETTDGKNIKIIKNPLYWNKFFKPKFLKNGDNFFIKNEKPHQINVNIVVNLN